MQEINETIIEEKNLRIQLIPSRRKKTRKVNMIIEGDFSIRTADLVKTHIGALLPQFDVIALALKNITAIDLTAVQLVQVISSPGILPQHSITVESELSREDRALLVNAGLLEIISR